MEMQSIFPEDRIALQDPPLGSFSDHIAAVTHSAIRAVRQSIEENTRSYDRRRALPALVGLTPDEANSRDPIIIGRLLHRIDRALRRERARGRAGAAGYDPARHLALVQAYKAEARALRPGGTGCL